MEEILELHRQAEADMNFRHPWFNMMYNWLVTFCVLMLIASFIWWGLDIHTRRQAEAMTEAVLAEMDAEHEKMMAEAEAAQKALLESEEHIIEDQSQAVAKAFYGIRNFIEKYRYNESDLETYARCMFNRSEAHGTDLVSVISEPSQFLGYADNNPILSEYYQTAMKLVRQWHGETVKPCDLSFQWAELTENGIYLRNDFNADGYARRYHA